MNVRVRLGKKCAHKAPAGSVDAAVCVTPPIPHGGPGSTRLFHQAARDR